jgi:hypothetical protein
MHRSGPQRCGNALCENGENGWLRYPDIRVYTSFSPDVKMMEILVIRPVLIGILSLLAPRLGLLPDASSEKSKEGVDLCVRD